MWGVRALGPDPTMACDFTVFSIPHHSPTPSSIIIQPPTPPPDPNTFSASVHTFHSIDPSTSLHGNHHEAQLSATEVPSPYESSALAPSAVGPSSTIHPTSFSNVSAHPHHTFYTIAHWLTFRLRRLPLSSPSVYSPLPNRARWLWKQRRHQLTHFLGVLLA